MKVHPFAELMPQMNAEQFAALLADVEANGLAEPIVTFEGKILDGRHRWLACQKARVQPKTRPFEGSRDQALRFVISANVHRRHLDETQRALIASKLATLPNHRPAKAGKLADLPTQAEAAGLLRVSERTVRNARVVLESGDADLIAQCERGEKRLGRAVSELKRAQREALGPSDTDFGSKRSGSTEEEGNPAPDYQKLRDRLLGHLDAIMTLLKECPGDEGWYECVRAELLAHARLIERREFERG